MISWWTLSLSSLLLCAFLITLDRFIYITKGLNYNVIMTKRVIAGLIFVSWAVPLLFVGLGIAIFDHRAEEILCISPHHYPGWYVLFGCSFSVMTLVGIYVFYTFILLKFYKQKKHLERARMHRESVRLMGSPTRSKAPMRVSHSLSTTSSNYSVPPTPMVPVHHSVARGTLERATLQRVAIERERAREYACAVDDSAVSAHEPAGVRTSAGRLRQQESTKKILARLVSVGKFVKSAQYVIVLLAVFTFAWTPWIVSLLSHAVQDYLGTF